MNNLLIINTPQIDYVNQSGESQRVYQDILTHLLYDTEFMKSVAVIGVVLDFFPITNEHYENVPAGEPMKCLSFTQGSAILPKIADNIHYMQECAIKKLPKNDGEKYERSVFVNRDSATFLLELLGSNSELPIDDVYLCGFSHDDSIFETVKLMSEFMAPSKLHIIDDLIYSDNPNEKNEIDLFCLDNGFQLNSFAKMK